MPVCTTASTHMHNRFSDVWFLKTQMNSRWCINVSPGLWVSLKCIVQQASVCVCAYAFNTISMQMIYKQELTDSNVTVLVSVAKTAISVCCHSVKDLLVRYWWKMSWLWRWKYSPQTLCLHSSVWTAIIIFPMIAVLCLDLASEASDLARSFSIRLCEELKNTDPEPRASCPNNDAEEFPQ